MCDKRLSPLDHQGVLRGDRGGGAGIMRREYHCGQQQQVGHLLLGNPLLGNRHITDLSMHQNRSNLDVPPPSLPQLSVNKGYLYLSRDI